MPKIDPVRFREAIARKGLNQADVAHHLDLEPANVTIWLTRASVPDTHGPSLDGLLGKSWRRVGAAPVTAEELSEVTEVSPFGLWLSRVRAVKGFSVMELAAEANLTPATIYNIESGRSQNPQKITRDALTEALGEGPGEEIIKVTEEDESVSGLGTLIDYDPHNRSDLPNVSAVYVFYDENDRISYVGQTGRLADRMRQEEINFWWYKPKTVKTARYIEIKDENIRKQFEALLIKIAGPLFNTRGIG